MELDLLELSGSPFDLGYRHGRRYGDQIWRFAQERVELAGSEAWTGQNLDRGEVIELAEACLDSHREFTPDGVEELEGMAAATGLSLPELLIVNGFTDFVDTVYALGSRLGTAGRAKADGAAVAGETAAGGTAAGATAAVADDCTAMLVPSSRSQGGQALFGQTWDMHASAAEHVLLLRGRPHRAPEFLTFTSVGCVGMIGMNEAGLVVGINNLMSGDGSAGVMWTFVVRELLKLETVADAVSVLDRVPLAGAHNYLLLDRHGRGANVEATGSRREVTPLAADSIVHTNHCLLSATQEVERERPEASQASSKARLTRAAELLSEGGAGSAGRAAADEPNGGGAVSPERLQQVMADEPTICVSPKPPLHVASCGAAIMRPATGEFWAVKGAPSRGKYSRYTVPA